MIKVTKRVMGMRGVVCIVDKHATKEDAAEIFRFYKIIDNVFSTYKKASEVTKINQGKILKKDYSVLMQKILKLSANTKAKTHGVFDVYYQGKLDPSGIVKGYAIHEAAKMLRKKGFKNFYVEISGDIEVVGKNKNGEKWKVGIKNPFNTREIIKVLRVSNCGIATSGNYERGEHIYNPLSKRNAQDLASITVIGPNVYEADRFATAAFAMEKSGITFIENLRGFEGYAVTQNKTGVATSKLSHYLYN